MDGTDLKIKHDIYCTYVWQGRGGEGRGGGERGGKDKISLSSNRITFSIHVKNTFLITFNNLSLVEDWF